MNVTKSSGVKTEKKSRQVWLLEIFPKHIILSHFHAFGYAILFNRKVSQNLLEVGWGVALVHMYVKRREIIP